MTECNHQPSEVLTLGSIRKAAYICFERNIAYCKRCGQKYRVWVHWSPKEWDAYVRLGESGSHIGDISLATYTCAFIPLEYSRENYGDNRNRESINEEFKKYV